MRQRRRAADSLVWGVARISAAMAPFSRAIRSSRRVGVSPAPSTAPMASATAPDRSASSSVHSASASLAGVAISSRSAPTPSRSSPWP